MNGLWSIENVNSTTKAGSIKNQSSIFAALINRHYAT